MHITTHPYAIRPIPATESSFEELHAYGSVFQLFIDDQETRLRESAEPRHVDDNGDYLYSLAYSCPSAVRAG